MGVAKASKTRKNSFFNLIAQIDVWSPTYCISGFLQVVPEVARTIFLEVRRRAVSCGRFISGKR